MSNLSHIVQRYLGMTPKDLGCTDWTEMQSKMEEEINEFFRLEKSKLVSSDTPDPIYINGKYGRIAGTVEVTMIEHDFETHAYAYLDGWCIGEIQNIDEMRPLTEDEKLTFETVGELLG